LVIIAHHPNVRHLVTAGMELSCIVLERVSPDIYAEITTYAVEVGTTARAVAALAQGSFPKYRARKENWHFDIEIYQVSLILPCRSPS